MVKKTEVEVSSITFTQKVTLEGEDAQAFITAQLEPPKPPHEAIEDQVDHSTQH